MTTRSVEPLSQSWIRRTVDRFPLLQRHGWDIFTYEYLPFNVMTRLLANSRKWLMYDSLSEVEHAVEFLRKINNPPKKVMMPIKYPCLIYIPYAKEKNLPVETISQGALALAAEYLKMPWGFSEHKRYIQIGMNQFRLEREEKRLFLLGMMDWNIFRTHEGADYEWKKRIKGVRYIA